MIKFYYNLAPNPTKVALFLETKRSFRTSRYRSIRAGASSSHLHSAINPNAKVAGHRRRRRDRFRQQRDPALSRGEDGKFLPPSTPARAVRCVVADVHRFGRRPVLGTGRALPPQRAGAGSVRDEPLPLRSEPPLGHRQHATRQARYMLGETYTFVDQAGSGGGRLVPYVLGDDAWTRLPKSSGARRDQRASAPRNARSRSRTRHTFKTEMDDEARSYVSAERAASGVIHMSFPSPPARG